MAIDVDDTYDVACAFLTAAYDALSLTDAGPPGRSYVNAGEAPMDCCGELVVWTQTLADQASQIPEPKQLRNGKQPLLTIIVRATRCAPTMKEENGRIRFPEPDALMKSAKMVEQDGWALWNHISAELRHGALAKVCAGAYRDGATKLIPQGGCVGWTFTFRYPIEGGLLGT